MTTKIVKVTKIHILIISKLDVLVIASSYDNQSLIFIKHILYPGYIYFNKTQNRRFLTKKHPNKNNSTQSNKQKRRDPPKKPPPNPKPPQKNPNPPKKKKNLKIKPPILFSYIKYKWRVCLCVFWLRWSDCFYEHYIFNYYLCHNIVGLPWNVVGNHCFLLFLCSFHKLIK